MKEVLAGESKVFSIQGWNPWVQDARQELV